MSEKASRHQRGDVFQITDSHAQEGWVGAFVLADEIREWGVIGYVHHIKSSDTHGQIWIRLMWQEIEYVGQAPLVPDPSEPVSPGP